MSVFAHVCFAVHWPSSHANVSPSPASLAWMRCLYNCTGVWLYLRRARTHAKTDSVLRCTLDLLGTRWRPASYLRKSSNNDGGKKKKQIVFARSAESSKRRCHKDNLSGVLWVTLRWRTASSGSISCFLWWGGGEGRTQVQTLISFRFLLGSHQL